MLFGGINIPEPVLTAHEEGRLVIFTGAGVSMSPPSNLPNFLGLAEQIGKKLQSKEDPRSPAWNQQPGGDPGSLEAQEKFQIHPLALSNGPQPGSETNPHHRPPPRLAANGPARVITTNYDLHLEQRL